MDIKILYCSGSTCYNKSTQTASKVLKKQLEGVLNNE